jgi:thioester reductase-like protein
MADIEDGLISIGKPIGHNVCCVLDEAGQILPDGEEGELLVGGPGVSMGYLDQPEKNSESFIFVAGMESPITGEPYRMYRTGDIVRRRSDGQHDFLGRRDHQVKIRGFRVELSAIDAAIMNTGHFSEVVATRMDAKEKGAGSTLVAFVVLHPLAGPHSVSDTIKTLREVLPEYMVPHIEVIAKLPLNSHAKLDRRMLNEMYHQRRDKCLSDAFGHGTLSTRDHVARIWATILATPFPNYSDDDDFFEHGATSLQASLLISRIRQQLKTEISLLTLYENSTLGKLVSSIDSNQGASTPTTRNERESWVADTMLGDNLSLPCGPVVDWRLDTEGRVFLTGGTGFLGAYMLADLLSLPNVYQIGCLVRATDAVAGLGRLKAAMAKYGLWKDSFVSKLLPLCGKLDDYWLGLGKQRFEQISQWASVVFHLGAKVNYTQPYSLHRSANIIGTLNIARFAVTGRIKGLHYSSSIACFGPTGFVTGAKIVYENAPLMPHIEALTFDHGYAQSQWAADELLRRLISRGFPITIYRPGFITGDDKTGVCNPDDFFSRLLVASLDLGCYPDLPNQRKEFIPVGYVVSSMLHIASNIFSSGHVFHLIPHRDASIGMGDVMDLLAKASESSIHCVSYEKWIERLSAGTNDSLQPLLPMLAEKVHQGLTRWEMYENMPAYDNTNTMRAVENYPGGLECPPFDCERMKRYVKYLAGS